MIRFTHKANCGESWPWYYGKYHYDFFTDQVYLMIIPFNYFAAIVRNVWWFLVRGIDGKHQADLSAAYQKGFEAGSARKFKFEPLPTHEPTYLTEMDAIRSPAEQKGG